MSFKSLGRRLKYIRKGVSLGAGRSVIAITKAKSIGGLDHGGGGGMERHEKF